MSFLQKVYRILYYYYNDLKPIGLVSLRNLKNIHIHIIRAKHGGIYLQPQYFESKGKRIRKEFRVSLDYTVMLRQPGLHETLF